MAILWALGRTLGWVGTAGGPGLVLASYGLLAQLYTENLVILGGGIDISVGGIVSIVNTVLATAGAAMAWMFTEWMIRGKPSMLGVASGAVAGLVAITPAAGFAGPMAAIVLGAVAGVACLWGVSGLKKALGYDDSLDGFGVHGIGGIIGAIGTGIVANPALGGSGVSTTQPARWPSSTPAARSSASCGASAPSSCGRAW